MTGESRNIQRRLSGLMVALALAVILAGCGDAADPTPDTSGRPARVPSDQRTSPTQIVETPTTGDNAATPAMIDDAVVGATPELAPDPDATPVAADASPVVVEGTPAAASAAAATPTAVDPRTVGALADRMDAAWGNVETYQAVTIETAPGGTPAAQLAPPADMDWSDPERVQAFAVTTDARVTVDRVVLPATRHLITVNNGEITEFIVVDGRVYVRGVFPRQAIRPDLEPTTWVDLDPARFPDDSPISLVVDQLGGLNAPGFRAPLADLQPETRDRELTRVDAVEIDGRVCVAYRYAETTMTGELITRTIAIDENDLPCLIETVVGEATSRATYDAFNQPLTVEAPTDAVPVGATPEPVDPTPAA